MNYYEILGVSRQSSRTEIAEAFRALAKKFHPDINKSQDAKTKFIAIYEAYSILKDEKKRSIYDKITFNEKEEKINNTTYSSWQKTAKEEGKYYANNKYDVFKKNVIDAIKDIARATGTKIAHRIIIGFIALILLSIYHTFRNREFDKRYAEVLRIRTEQNTEMQEILSTINDYVEIFPEKEIAFNLKDEKIIILEDGKLSDLVFELPEQFRAKNKNEINYIIQLFRKDIVVGKYYKMLKDSKKYIKLNGNFNLPSKLVYQIVYTYKIVDYREKATVFSEEVMGSEPPKEISESHNGYGISPIRWIYQEKILNWLINGAFQK